ncbi:MAG: phosphatidate cytidylyltransferase [Desulfobacterales bacterium]
MHLKRWITGLATLPFLFLLILKGGGQLFAVVVGAVAMTALWEYFRLVSRAYENVSSTLNRGSQLTSNQISASGFQFLSFLTGFALIWAAYILSFKLMIALIIWNFLLSGLISIKRFRDNSGIPESVFKQVSAIIYIPLFLSYLVLIRNSSSGMIWIFFILCIVFAGDTGAYYIGSYFGRHKLCPSVSPGKTVEGSIGGLAINLCAGALFKWYFLPSLPWGLSILLFFSIGIAAQIGDLFESTLKRVANVKDSGVAFPGHGGMLDRIDALIFAAPVTYFFKTYILINS